MAKDTQSKKRKASVPDVDAEKVKKVKNAVAAPAEAPAKKRKATDDAAPINVKKSKTPKPILKGSSEVEAAANAEKPTKKSSAVTPKATKKETNGVKKAEKAVVSKSSKTAAVSAKQANATKNKQAKLADIEADEELDSGLEDEDKDMEEDSDSEVDDQTQALLDGFESDGDDADNTNTEGLPEGAPVPARKELSKKEEKRLKKAAEAGASDKPGVIYIGRIPHGFYENEMKAYFKQFGNILKLRMSRNKKTGASKHYAWIQFESATVADIVARTMDNYLMFGHLLKVKFVPEEQVNPEWFKGANKRFKKVPWNKMEGRKLEQGASEEAWNERVSREEQRRQDKAKKLKDIGYEFNAPQVKSATGVAKPKAIEELITNGESEVKAIEAAPTEDSSKPKKKGKKAKADSTSLEPVAGVSSKAEKKEHRAAAIPPTKEDVEESIDALISESAEKPKKKAKKAKAVQETEVIVEETVTIVEEPSKPKAKKGKKTKGETVDEVAEVAVAEVPEKKLKTKKSKISVVETTIPVEAAEEKVKKGKKGKKEKSVA